MKYVKGFKQIGVAHHVVGECVKLVGGEGSQGDEADKSCQSDHSDGRLVLPTYSDFLNELVRIPVYLMHHPFSYEFCLVDLSPHLKYFL